MVLFRTPKSIDNLKSIQLTLLQKQLQSSEFADIQGICFLLKQSLRSTFWLTVLDSIIDEF
jgi:hypothetical protein